MSFGIDPEGKSHFVVGDFPVAGQPWNKLQRAGVNAQQRFMTQSADQLVQPGIGTNSVHSQVIRPGRKAG